MGAAVSTFGRLGVLVNNAGICRFAPIDEVTREDRDMQIAVNLIGRAKAVMDGPR